MGTAADALFGAGHILAEWFSERADLRGRAARSFSNAPASWSALGSSRKPREEPEALARRNPLRRLTRRKFCASATEDEAAAAIVAEAPSRGHAWTRRRKPLRRAPAESSDESTGDSPSLAAVDAALTSCRWTDLAAESLTTEDSVEAATAATAVASAIATEPESPLQEAPATVPAPAVAATVKGKRNRNRPASPKPDPKREKLLKALRDYYQYSEAIDKVPPHRVLAINRGERAKSYA